MMRRILILLAVLIALPILALAAMSAWSRFEADPELVDGRLRACPDRPNCVRSEPDSGVHATTPLPYLSTRAATEQALREILQQDASARIVKAQGAHWHLVYTSRLMRFIDDLELRFDDQARFVHLRSGSRVGHSDLGVNDERATALRKAMDARLLAELANDDPSAD